MNRAELIAEIRRKKTMLCVGLDVDMDKIPQHLLNHSDPVFAFNKAIIDATAEFAVAYKPNTAFYECMGTKGWESLQKTIDYIPSNCFVIADAKRGDIGNTAERYARTFFETMACDAVTVAPYMGEDSVKPFLSFHGKWAIVLGLTSNKGAEDFQLWPEDQEALYERVIKKCKQWGNPEKLMFVIGATKATRMQEIRALAPEHFFLVPGVGAQGGDLDEVCRTGMNKDCGLLINASRSVIYASSGEDFAEAAAAEAKKLKQIMQKYL
jgi:orotidine-5'-phosphate decarboxylase